METKKIVIKCPHCQFSKPVDKDKLPSERRKINCPSCHDSFEYFPVEEPLELNVKPEVAPLSAKENEEILGLAKRKTEEDSDYNSPTKINIFIGTMFTVSSFIPAGILFNYISKGMYGPFFKKFSPAIFHIVSVSFSFVISAILVAYLFKSLRVFQRLHKSYASNLYFGVGNSLMIVYLIIRIFASSIPGGGPPLAVAAIGALPVFLAKILLTIGIMRVAIGIDPTK